MAVRAVTAIELADSVRGRPSWETATLRRRPGRRRLAAAVALADVTQVGVTRTWTDDLGYRPELANVPESAVESFAGVARPFSLGRLQTASTTARS